VTLKTSRDMTVPWFERRAAAMTASFSTGFREQVEYTSLPSSLSIFIALCRILSCNLVNSQHNFNKCSQKACPCNPFPSFDCQLFQIPMFFLNVPSPLHGTSQSILSNRSTACLLSAPVCATLRAGYIDASRLVTMSAGLGKRAD
jgi:hypothetical protein